MATINTTIDDAKLSQYSNACQWNDPSLKDQGFSDQQVIKKWIKGRLQDNNLLYKKDIYVPENDNGIS